MDPIVPADTDAPAPVAPVDAPAAAPLVPVAAPVVVAVPAPAEAVAAAPAAEAVAGVGVSAPDAHSGTPLNFDAADPAVALLAWALTFAVGRWCPKGVRVQVRKVLPLVAVLLACAVSAGVAAVQGEPLTVAVLLRGLGAAGAAVLAHSQLREALKPQAPKA